MLGNKIKKADQKARKRFYGANYYFSIEELKKYGNIKKFIGMYRKTTKVCSKPWCCGNPRRNTWSSKKERLTIQERKANESKLYDEKIY